MIADTVLAMFHHLLAFGMVGLIMAEWVILRGAPSEDVLQRIARIDGFYGVSAVALLIVGVLRVIYGVKGYAFYTGNPVFWLKIALFVATGLLSVMPTMRFIRWSRAVKQDSALPEAASWFATRRLIVWELHCLSGVMICAALMARGIGH
ncbi:MAG: DUF2214 family protein [Casimicrobium sp.]|jgi:putative membrane protein